MSASLLDALCGLQPIPEADQALITAAWQPRSLAAGATLLAAGSVCRELFFIQQGVVRLLLLQPDGRELVYYFLQENQFCTELVSFTTQAPAGLSIQAVGPLRVLAISKQRLEELYGQLPYLPALLSQVLQQGLLDKLAVRRAYLGQDSTARYQQFLHRQPDIARRVPLADVASYLEVTPQSLSRIRRHVR